jgi:hypothetical protein
MMAMVRPPADSVPVVPPGDGSGSFVEHIDGDHVVEVQAVVLLAAEDQRAGGGVQPVRADEQVGVFDRTVAEGRVDGVVILINVGDGGAEADFGSAVGLFVEDGFDVAPQDVHRAAADGGRDELPRQGEASLAVWFVVDQLVGDEGPGLQRGQDPHPLGSVVADAAEGDRVAAAAALGGAFDDEAVPADLP